MGYKLELMLLPVADVDRAPRPSMLTSSSPPCATRSGDRLTRSDDWQADIGQRCHPHIDTSLAARRLPADPPQGRQIR